jgi:hypothetical protein
MLVKRLAPPMNHDPYYLPNLHSKIFKFPKPSVTLEALKKVDITITTLPLTLS